MVKEKVGEEHTEQTTEVEIGSSPNLQEREENVLTVNIESDQVASNKNMIFNHELTQIKVRTSVVTR